jgi:hypothetical protein
VRYSVAAEFAEATRTAPAADNTAHHRGLHNTATFTATTTASTQPWRVLQLSAPQPHRTYALHRHHLREPREQRHAELLKASTGRPASTATEELRCTLSGPQRCPLIEVHLLQFYCRGVGQQLHSEEPAREDSRSCASTLTTRGGSTRTTHCAACLSASLTHEIEKLHSQPLEEADAAEKAST